MYYSSSESSYYDDSSCYSNEYSEEDEAVEFGVYVIDSSAKCKVQPYGTVEFKPHENINYRNLIFKLHQTFPVLKSESYYLSCVDEYGNVQEVNDDEDLDTVMQEFEDEKNLYVIYKEEIENNTGDSFPTQYYCNFCCFALNRFRYKCTVCPEYDLCSRCINNEIHSTHEFEYLDIVDSEDSSELEINQIDYNYLWGERFIGEGSFGTVFTTHDRRSNDKVAIKYFKDFDGMKNSFLAELEVLEELGEHENVVKVLGYCVRTQRPKVGLVMECVSMEINGRELSGLNMYLMYLRRLFKSKTPIDHRELDSFALQIARGMEHLEYKNVLHRDLAARNILIDSNKTLKISDFGLSRIGDYYQGEYGIFAARWAAPEVIEYENYSNKSDVWAFGVVLWEIATLGALPYCWLDTDEVMEFVRKNGHLYKPRSVSDRLFHIMERCWTKRPENRPDFSDLVDKLLDFKWMASAYCDFDDLYDDFELPYAWEVYEQRLNRIV